MSVLNGIMNTLRQLLEWWIIISPWEQAVRVRLGKHLKVLEAGVHWRFPFIDKVQVQTTRLRYTDTPAQTVTTACGKTVTFSGTLGYVIEDILKLYQTLHHADDTIKNLAMAAAAAYIRGVRWENCKSDVFEKTVTEAVDLSKYGLGKAKYSLLDLARVKTFRLIQGQNWSTGDALAIGNRDR